MREYNDHNTTHKNMCAGTNWAKSKAKGYKYGGPVLNQLGKAEALLPKIAKKAKKKSRKV